MSGVAWKYIWCVPVAIGRIVNITFYGLQVISLCEVEIYGVPVPCRSNPCNNGKTCRRIGNNNSYECLCPPGFNGSNCTDAIPCWSTPCHNGGSCRNTKMRNVYQCFCPGNTKGSNCEDFKPCWSNPCHNGGSCRTTEMSNVYQSFCPGNTTGSIVKISSHAEAIRVTMVALAELLKCRTSIRASALETRRVQIVKISSHAGAIRATTMALARRTMLLTRVNVRRNGQEQIAFENKKVKK